MNLDEELERSLGASGVLVARSLGIRELDSYIQLAPNRDLPAFVESATSLASRAHRCAAIWGALADRVADGQGEHRDAEQVVDRAYASWRSSLEKLAPGRGDAALARATAKWREATELERAILTSTQLKPSPNEYREVVRDKLAWITVSAELALDDDDARALREGYSAFLFALQLRDDAADMLEDRETLGGSWPDALGYPYGALICAAPFVVDFAVSKLARFDRLATWMRNFRAEIENERSDQPPPLVAFGAMQFLTELGLL